MALAENESVSLGRYLSIYFGAFMLVCGLVGSSMNFWLFSRSRFRQSPCSRYILVENFFDFVHLLSALLFRILSNGIQSDPSSRHLPACRIRYFIVTWSGYASLGCRCLAAFDRYACTSRSISLRNWSSSKTANRFLMMNIVFWACFAIPNLFFFELIPTGSNHFYCSVNNEVYKRYYAFFVSPVLYFALPVSLMVLFTIKTHENLRQMMKTRQIRRIDRQLTVMIILQTLMNSISSIPYGIYLLHAAISDAHIDNGQGKGQEPLCVQIIRLSYYFNFISSFYIYYVSSPSIRHTIRNRSKTRLSDGHLTGEIIFYRPLSEKCRTSAPVFSSSPQKIDWPIDEHEHKRCSL